jgi:hypothetical protein
MKHGDDELVLYVEMAPMHICCVARHAATDAHVAVLAALARHVDAFMLVLEPTQEQKAAPHAAKAGHALDDGYRFDAGRTHSAAAPATARASTMAETAMTRMLVGLGLERERAGLRELVGGEALPTWND